MSMSLPAPGEPEKWQLLVKAMERAAYRVLRNQQDAEDCVMKVIEEAHPAHDRTSSDKNGRPLGRGWYIQRVQLRAIDLLRSQRAASKKHERYARLQQSKSLQGIAPDRLHDVFERAMIVFECLMELDPPIRRAIIRMALLEGRPIREVILRWPGVTKAEANWHIHAGLRAIATKLAAKGITSEDLK